MSNVVRLFAQMNAEIAVSEHETGFSIAATSIVASTQQLSRTIKELSTLFDAVENAIDTVEDVATRTRFKQSTRVSREALSESMLKLSRQLGKIADNGA
jgi:hypothetical protein